MKILCLDWGLKKVGLAYSEGDLASPLTNLIIKGLDDGVKQVVELVKKEGIIKVVIGLPEGEMGKKVEKAVKLFQKNKIAVETTDETLSTRDAKELAIEMGMGKKARKDDDSFSAAIILQRYLDEKE